MIDVIDCSGSGDVSTAVARSAEQTADGQLVLEGLTGRKLRLGAWAATNRSASAQFQLGVLRAYDVYPRDLVERCVLCSAAAAAAAAATCALYVPD